VNRYFRIVLVAIGIVFLFVSSSVAETSKSSGKKSAKKSTVVKEDNLEVEKKIIGRTERVRVIPGDFVFDARIDTGANTSSLGVDSLEIINEDGQEWVEITIDGKKSKHEIVKYIYIKEHGEEASKRPVIQVRLILGEVSESVNVTLANRSNFKYNLLVGRNMLHDRFIVDVSLRYTVEPMPYKE
jgi:hypothetical protein